MQFNLLALGVALCVATSAAPAYAGFSNPANEIAEVMMQAQQSDAFYIDSIFGADAPTTLTFSSSMDIVNKTFNYSLNPGSTYQGMSTSLGVTGTFDQNADAWKWTSAGSLGAHAWQGSGSMAIIGDPLAPGYYNVLDNSVFKMDFVIVYNEAPITKSAAVGTFSFLGHPIYLLGVDNLDEKTGQFVWSDVAAISRIDGWGGPGNFSIHIMPVPEPSTAWLFGIGGFILLAYKRRIRSGE